MAEVKFIEFKDVPGAPKIRLPADLSEEDTKNFLKSEEFENAMLSNGFNFKYGLQPVNVLEMENLDDGSFTSSYKAGWDATKAMGTSALASFYDFVGAKENQEEALQQAQQYILDSSAHAFQIDKDGKILPRPQSIEQIVNDEDQLTAFTKYLKHTGGNALATTIPVILTSIVGGVIGSAIPGAGTVLGATAGAALGSYIFGLGDTYLAQREAGAIDPNAGLSMALAVPYAAVEVGLGAGGRLVPSLVRTFGSRTAAMEAMQKGMVKQIKNKQKGNLRKIGGFYGKGVPLTMLGEGLAESFQETLNRTAEGSVIGFDKLYSDKEFHKQLGEAAAAGFFGGFGFGVINPTAKTIKLLGKGTGPVDMKGGAAISNLDSVTDSEPFFVDQKYTIGDTVTVDNIMLPDINNKETPLFGMKPEYKMVGTAELDGQRQYILSQTNIPGSIATVPIAQAGMINKVDPPTGGAEPGENFIYDTESKGETVNVNKNLRTQYSNSKKALVQTGYIDNATDTTVEKFLGGREKVVGDVVHRIESARASQKLQQETMTPEAKKELEDEGIDITLALDPINTLFKKYDKFTGDKLKQEVDKDYSFWRDLELIDSAEENAQENNITAEEQERLTKLGYQTGPRGRDYVNRLIGNVGAVNNNISAGRQQLNNILKNETPFSAIPDLMGGPYTEKIEVGERITTTEPLTASQKASITGDKLISIMKYNPMLVMEGATFEDLYNVPANERMRMILQLADALDSTGVKRKYLTQYNELRKAVQEKVNAARNTYGMLSESYKQARQELKDFNNFGEHIIRADRRMGDIQEEFRLFQVLSPKAIRAAERQIEKLLADSRYRSTDAIIKGPLVSQVVAYKALISNAYRSRKQLNDLLKSLSLEPITDWETVTLSKIKSQITKLKKQLNQTETEVKRRKITGEFTRFNLQKSPDYGSKPPILLEADESAPLIAESMRIFLDKLGLSKTDLIITNKIVATIGGEVVNPVGQHIKTPTDVKAKFPDLPPSVIQYAFNLEKYNAINKRLSDNNYTDPKLKQSDWYAKNLMVGEAIMVLGHEGLHALKEMGVFTNKEWKMLEQQADDQWIKEYDVDKIYPPNIFSLAQRREEGIAFAFGSYAMERRSPPNSSTKQIFARLKAILLALANGLRGAGFTTPDSIFNKIASGLIGARNRTQRETANIYQSKNLDKVMKQAGRSSIVMSNNFSDNPITYAEQQTWLRVILEMDDININTNMSLRFTSNPSKLKWSTKLESFAIGVTGNLTAADKMYTYMTPDDYLNLTGPMEYNEYDVKALKFMAQAVTDKKEFGMPDLIIELTSDGVGRVVGQEGRHRAETAKRINGAQSNIPVAISIIDDTGKTYESSGQLTRDNKRNDPVNKKTILNYIGNGVLMGMDRSIFLDDVAGGNRERARIESESPIRITKEVLPVLFESFETLPGGSLQFGNQYMDYAGQPDASTEVGSQSFSDDIKFNRQDKRQAEAAARKALEQSSEAFADAGGTATVDNLSTFQRIMGHARAIAKLNTPFTYLFNAVMNTVRKNRQLQQQFSDILSQKYLRVIQDPNMKEMMAKAMIIAQMTGVMDMKVDSNERLIFIAPEDGGASDMPVAKGEMVVLEGDVAKAFIDVHRVFQDVNKEFLKAEIAREHIPNLIMGLNLLRRFMPNLPELKTLFNFQGLDQEQISNRLEELDYTQIKFIVDSLSNIMIMQTSMQGDVTEQIQNLLGNKDSGLNALLTQAGQTATLNKKMYVPLMRFGKFFVSVKQKETITDEKTGEVKEVDKLLWYQQFESMGQANESLNSLRIKFPDAEISTPAELTLQRLRQLVKEGRGFKNLEYLAQFMSDTNARNYQEILKTLRETLATKGLDKDVMGINQFYVERDKSVGAEGVPGYSADFPRSIMQYLSIAANTIARNRYSKDKNKYYDQTIKYALDKGDSNLEKFTESFYNYQEDPVQEFGNLRRMGFWWYLGGNLSSAVLQTMSLVQFTGPILSQLGGTKNTIKELSKAFSWASSMVAHGVSGERQYQDAFLDFNKIPDGPIREALMRAIADGTIKQGQAFQEAGITPGMGGTLVGSQQQRNKVFREVENILVGGAFNTFEAASRITAFIATYNLAVNDPKVLDQADALYGDDADYQYTMETYGRSPEALARFMTDETFGVYGKENRQALGRGLGSLAALFMTYMTQMTGLMFRLLNPPVIKKVDGKFQIGLHNPAKTAMQNKIGRRAFARIMLMMLMTGGVLGLPGGEDAEDLYDMVKKMYTGVDSDVRTEFRNMLYEAGWGPGMINAMENGLINSTLGWDVQKRVGFGILPWSQQVRAGLNMLGIPTGARAEEFLGAPGSIFIDAARGLSEQGVREGNWGKAIQQMFPTSIRNIMKAAEYSPYGNGYVSTGYGQVLTQDIKGWEVMMQAFGFAPASIAREREALYQERKLDKGMNTYRQRYNSRITNALRDVIMGGMRYDANMVNEGQQEVSKLLKEIMARNADQPPHLRFIPDISGLYKQALMAINPDYRAASTNRKLYREKKNIRLALGLD
mgnify:CR=1 FL=1